MCASRTLTVNLGLRYETESPYTDNQNHLNYFDPTVPSPAANMHTASSCHEHDLFRPTARPAQVLASPQFGQRWNLIWRYRAG